VTDGQVVGQFELPSGVERTIRRELSGPFAVLLPLISINSVHCKQHTMQSLHRSINRGRLILMDLPNITSTGWKGKKALL